MKKQRALSKTPRHPAHSRKIRFSMEMRERISKKWVAFRKKTRKK